MLALTTLYWGLSFPLIKSITLLNAGMFPGAGSWFLSAGALAPRFLLAAALVHAGFPGRGWGLRAPEVAQGLALAFFASGGLLLQTDGLQYTDASVSAFLTQFSAVLIPVWLALRRRRSPGAAVWAGCLLVLAGGGVLARVDPRSLRIGRGEVETLLASAFFMVQILVVEAKGFGANRPGRVTRVMFLAQAAVFAAVGLATAPPGAALLRPWSSPPWIAMTFILTLVCTVWAFSIMNAWQPRIAATQAGLVYCLEPVFASILVLFLPSILSRFSGISYPDEHLSWSLVVGGALITAANLVVQFKPAPGRSP